MFARVYRRVHTNLSNGLKNEQTVAERNGKKQKCNTHRHTANKKKRQQKKKKQHSSDAKYVMTMVFANMTNNHCGNQAGTRHTPSHRNLIR